MGKTSPKGTLARHPDMTPLELGMILLKEHDPVTRPWKILMHKYGYSKERLRQLRLIAQAAIDAKVIDPPI